MPAADASHLNSSRNDWWVPVVRGFLAIAFGVLSAAIPRVTVVVLLMLFAAFALLDGVVSLVSVIGKKSGGCPLFGGLLSVAIGTLTMLLPISPGFALVTLIPVWAIIRGVLDVVAALTTRGELASRLDSLPIASGIVSILFGFFIAVSPLLGVPAIVGLIAGLAILLGFTLGATGLRQRSLWRRDLRSPAGQTI